MISFDEYRTLSPICHTAKNQDECIFSGAVIENIGKEKQEPWEKYITCSWDNRGQALKRFDGEMYLVVGDPSEKVSCILRPVLTDKVKIR